MIYLVRRYFGNLIDLSRLIGLLGKPGVLLVALMLLSACNSGSLSDGLESAATPQPTQSVGTEPLPQNSGQLPLTTEAEPNQQVAALPSGKSVTFLPVSNAPQNAVTQLARSIRSAAAQSGLPVVASVQQGAQYQVKGYFSALEDGSGTLLVYVWDVLDRNNKRIYRINGQEQTSNKSSDPWTSVTPTMLDRVAKNTTSQLKSWLTTR